MKFNINPKTVRKGLAIIAAIAGISALALSIGTPASAAEKFDLTYTATDGSGDYANLALVGNLISPDEFAVTSVSGNVDGAITPGVEPISNPNSPNMATSADGLFNYDDILFNPGNPSFTTGGLLFNVIGSPFNVEGCSFASVCEINLYSEGSNEGGANLYTAQGGAYKGNSTGNFSVIDMGPVGVPEPATWAFMLFGFGGLGASMRSSRRKTIAAAV